MDLSFLYHLNGHLNGKNDDTPLDLFFTLTFRQTQMDFVFLLSFLTLVCAHSKPMTFNGMQ